MGILRHGIQAHGVIPITAVSSSSASYRERVMLTNPIRYYPLWETSGTVATELIAADDGTYARNVTTMGTGAGIGDGYTAPLFDGTNDYINILSAALNTAFDGDEFTLSLWVRVSAVGIWTDGLDHTLFRMRVDANNQLSVAKPSTNSRLLWVYESNNVILSGAQTELSTTTWMNYALRVTRTGDGVRAWLSGVEIGSATAIDVANAWTGNLAVGANVIGAGATTPVGPSSFYIAHVALFPVLSVSQILLLAAL